MRLSKPAAEAAMAERFYAGKIGPLKQRLLDKFLPSRRKTEK